MAGPQKRRYIDADGGLPEGEPATAESRGGEHEHTDVPDLTAAGTSRADTLEDASPRAVAPGGEPPEVQADTPDVRPLAAPSRRPRRRVLVCLSAALALLVAGGYAYSRARKQGRIGTLGEVRKRLASAEYFQLWETPEETQVNRRAAKRMAYARDANRPEDGIVYVYNYLGDEWACCVVVTATVYAGDQELSLSAWDKVPPAERERARNRFWGPHAALEAALHDSVPLLPGMGALFALGEQDGWFQLGADTATKEDDGWCRFVHGVPLECVEGEKSSDGSCRWSYKAFAQR